MNTERDLSMEEIVRLDRKIKEGREIYRSSYALCNKCGGRFLLGEHQIDCPCLWESSSNES